MEGEPLHVTVRRAFAAFLAAGAPEDMLKGLVSVGRRAVWYAGGAPAECPLSTVVESAVVADEAIPSGAMTDADRSTIGLLGLTAIVEARTPIGREGGA